MLSILLIDDEDLELEGLTAMIGSMELECTICGKARNAAQGIEMAEVLHPDVILSDVKMPKMDGIEMARRIKELGIETFLVFISGYQDFTAAQQAISLGAKAYLLKPVNRDSLRSVLLEAGSDRQKTLQEEVQRLNLAQDRKRLEQYEKAEYLKKLFLKKNMTEEQLKEETRKLQIPFPNGFYAVCLICLYHSDPQDKFLESEIPEELYTVVQKYNAFPPVLLSPGEIGILFNYPEMLSEKTITHQLLEAGEAIRDVVVPKVELQLNIGISNISHLIETIPSLVGQARRAAGQVLQEGYGQVAFLDEIPIESVEMSGHFPPASKELLAAISEGKRERWSQCVDRLYTSWSRSYAREEVLASCIDILTSVQNQCRELGLKKELLEEKELYTALLECASLRKILDYMLNYGFQLCDTVRERQQDQGQQAVQMVEQIIREEYGNPLSVEEIAERVFLSPSYISRLFKKQTGETILDYLQSVRMKKALELLNQPQYRIYEVATMTGYENASYFSMVFKKYYGSTPGKYRESRNIYERI